MLVFKEIRAQIRHLSYSLNENWRDWQRSVRRPPVTFDACSLFGTGPTFHIYQSSKVSSSPLLSNQTLPTCEVVILYCNGLGQFILLFITNYFSILMCNRDFTQKELPLIRR